MDFAVGVSPVDFQVPPPQERRTAGSPERAGSWTLGVVGLVQTQQEGTAAASACEQLRDESASNRKAIANERSKRGLRFAFFNNSIANDVCDRHNDRNAIATQSQTARSRTELLHCKRMA